MRRADRAVTDPQEIVSIMSRCEVVHLAMNREGAPYLLPFNFGMEPDGMTLYIHGAREGTKYALLERDPRVAFAMEVTSGLVLDEKDHSCTMNYESVAGTGVAEEVTDPAEKRRALARIMAQYHAEDFPFDPSPMAATRILRVRVGERAAKRREKRG